MPDEIRANETHAPRILLTGATGHIGRHVLTELLDQSFNIRAVTSRELTPAQRRPDPRLEWRHHDFTESLNVDELVSNCDGILHLAAHTWDAKKMLRLNVEATRALAKSANRHGVKYFGFTSSVAVYGSSRFIMVDENAPLLTPDSDLKNEYRGNPALRAYGRSKVLAEHAIIQAAGDMQCTIFRPTVVVDLPEIVSVIRRSGPMAYILGNRHEHFIYVRDVACALVWFLRRCLNLSENRKPNRVEIFNLSDDACEIPSGRKMAERAFLLTQMAQFKPRPAGPLWVYNFFDLIKNRCLSLRYPLGMMNFSSKKILDTGYRHKFGMSEALRLAIEGEGRATGKDHDHRI